MEGRRCGSVSGVSYAFGLMSLNWRVSSGVTPSNHSISEPAPRRRSAGIVGCSADDGRGHAGLGPPIGGVVP